MKISEAIAKRILQLCDEKNITINALAVNSYLTQSTVQSIVSGKSKNPTTLTIARICEAFKISIKDFYDSKLFDNLDIEL